MAKRLRRGKKRRRKLGGDVHPSSFMTDSMAETTTLMRRVRTKGNQIAQFIFIGVSRNGLEWFGLVGRYVAVESDGSALSSHFTSGDDKKECGLGPCAAPRRAWCVSEYMLPKDKTRSEPILMLYRREGGGERYM